MISFRCHSGRADSRARNLTPADAVDGVDGMPVLPAVPALLASVQPVLEFPKVPPARSCGMTSVGESVGAQPQIESLSLSTSQQETSNPPEDLCYTCRIPTEAI